MCKWEICKRAVKYKGGWYRMPLPRNLSELHHPGAEGFGVLRAGWAQLGSSSWLSLWPLNPVMSLPYGRAPGDFLSRPNWAQSSYAWKSVPLWTGSYWGEQYWWSTYWSENTWEANASRQLFSRWFARVQQIVLVCLCGQSISSQS